MPKLRIPIIAMVIQIKVSSLGKPSSTSINERNANGNAKTVSSILTSRKKRRNFFMITFCNNLLSFIHIENVAVSQDNYLLNMIN